MMEVGTNFDSWPCRDSNDDMKSETKIGGVLAPLTATGSPLSSVSPAQLLPPTEHLGQLLHSGQEGGQVEVAVHCGLVAISQHFLSVEYKIFDGAP